MAIWHCQRMLASQLQRYMYIYSVDGMMDPVETNHSSPQEYSNCTLTFQVLEFSDPQMRILPQPVLLIYLYHLTST